MTAITLPSGDTAEIADADKLTAGIKLAVQRSVTVAVTNGKMALNLAIQEEMKVAALAHLITSWSKQVPVTAASIEALPLKDYNALTDAIKEHMGLLRTVPDKSDAAED